jgi:hypothetical protein
MRGSKNGQDELVDLWLMTPPSTRPHAADGRLSPRSCGRIRPAKSDVVQTIITKQLDDFHTFSSTIVKACA